MQRNSIGALALFGAAWALAGVALETAAADRPAPPAPAEVRGAALVHAETGRLKNGLRVVSLTDPHAAVATFQVWYATGSRDEQPGSTGLSQLVEALYFQGTKTVGRDEFVRRIQQSGGVAGGQVTADYTSLWEALPPDQLELAARLEADRMANLALTPEALDAARTAVRRQRMQDVEASSLGRGLELLDSLAYQGSAYRWPASGSPQDLSALTLEQARAWYATRYTPDKAVVVIAGPTTHESNLKLVERWFGKLKAGRAAPAPDLAAAASPGPRQGTVTWPGAAFPLLVVGYRTPPDASPDAPVLDVIGRLLAGGSSSRLARELVERQRLAFFAGASAVPRQAGGVFYAVAGLRAGGDRDSLERALTALVEGLAHAEVTDDDLAGAQAQLETSYWYGLDQVQDRASAVATATLLDGDPAALAARVERWQAVKKEDVARVARTYLAPENRVSIWVVAPARSGS